MRTTCYKCGDPLDGSHKSYCKKCQAAYARSRYQWTDERRAQQREWREKNRDHHNRSQNARRYGLTLDEYDAIIATKVCVICGKDANQIDHCHVSGEVRGLLCQTCNVGLGAFKDDPALLMKAAAYLRGEVPELTAL